MIQVEFNREPVIRFLAEADDRNQRWLSRQTGVSEATISRLLNYPLPAPEVRVAEKLARVVGCSPLELYIEIASGDAINGKD